MSYTKKQKEQIEYLKSVCDTDEQTVIDCLKKANWDSNRASDIYWTNPKPYVEKKPTVTKGVEEAFKKYKEKDTDEILYDGLLLFIKDIGIEPDDAVMLVISYCFKATSMGKYTKTEFCNGMASLGYQTADDVKKNLKTLRAKLDNEKELKDIYQWVFNYAKEPSARSLNFDSALALWELLLTGKFKFLKQWLDFLNGRESKSDIPKDLWNMVFEFHQHTKGDLTKFEEGGSWPSMIDDFVEYVKMKQEK